MQLEFTAKSVSSARLLRLSFSLAITLSLAGCSSTSTPVALPTFPYAGLTLRVACPSAEAEALVRAASRSWVARQKAIDVVPVRYDPIVGPASVADADVWVIPAWMLPHEADAGRLLPIPETLTRRDAEYGWMSLLPLYRDQLLAWGWDRGLRQRVAWGLPVRGEGLVCCYRADWLDDPANQEAFKAKYDRRLPRPATWHDVAELAEFFQQHGGAAKPSLPPLPSDDDALAREFFSVAAGFARRAVPADEALQPNVLEDVLAFQEDPEKGLPRIDEAGFVYALTVLQKLQPFRAKEGADPLAAFRAGQAVVCFTDPPGVARLQQDTRVRDRFGIAPMPGGDRYFAGGKANTGQNLVNRVPYLGAAVLTGVVPRTAQHAEAAFSLLARMTDRETSTEVVLDPRWGGGAIRLEQLEERGNWNGFDLDAVRNNELKDALRQTLLHRGLKNPALVLRLPDAVAEHDGKRTFPYRDALVRAVRAAVQEGKAPGESLALAAQTWKALAAKRGKDKHLADVRLSLGLLPNR
jgi:ABC-type glycerol-3-phosphate transport system substrate-binding protein